MFTSIGTLIKTLPKRSKTPGAILALHVRQAFGESVKRVCEDLPDDTLGVVKPSVFKDGVLTVISSPLVCAELTMRASGLVREINKTLGKNVVLKLRFRTA